ncbi:MAG: hypothetical protein ACLVBJ_10195 [Pilosibacter sp.]
MTKEELMKRTGLSEESRDFKTDGTDAADDGGAWGPIVYHCMDKTDGIMFVAPRQDRNMPSAYQKSVVGCS